LKAAARLWLRIGHAAQVPVTYVENCAEAVVQSAEKAEAIGQIFNIIDSDPPSQSQYVKKLRAYASPQPVVIPIPWTVMRVVAGMAWLTNRALFRGQAKVPGLLKPPTVHTRFKPLQYPNARIRDILDWSPRYALDEALWRCVDREES
jgi:nucleoside-diphosphate-sugar epimerase